jgi:quercetin dioxygenase-like cupin family protein
VKRHAGLVPLSHGHHHALVEARRLRRAADGDDTDRRDAVDRFLRFFSSDTIRHFREEEEQLFPLLADHDDGTGELVVQVLLEHQRVHALVRRLEGGLAANTADPSLMRELADLLEAHVRLEERRLFPAIEETLPEASLGELDLERTREAAKSPVIDLFAPAGSGPLWGAETEDLNATLLSWPAGHGPPEHVNSERDVILIVLEGEATVTLNGESHTIRAGDTIVVEKGRSRSIAAGPEGVRYLSIHRRRGPLQISRTSA